MGKSVQKCDYCGFSSKNVYILKRHKLRCRKQHGIGRSSKTLADEGQADFMDSLPLPGPTVDSEDAMESGPETLQQESGSISGSMTGEEADLDDDSKTLKAKPTFTRNYRCNKCEFRTLDSREFLYHMNEQHGSNYDIFACNVCEYCSRYRHKIQRHMRFAHKVDLELDDVQAEYLSTEKVLKPVKPKPEVQEPRANPRKRKPIMSKSTHGKRLVVKFKKKEGSDTVTAVKVRAPNIKEKTEAIKPASASGQSTGNVSRVVEETEGEDGEPVFKCRECQFISDDKQKVAKHAASWHVDIKCFQCNHCEFITFERSDFIAHRFHHRNEHLYKCTECTYSSDYVNNFEKHQQCHKANLPHKCPLCSYSSVTETAIKRHVTINHDQPKAKLPIIVPKVLKPKIDKFPSKSLAKKDKTSTKIQKGNKPSTKSVSNQDSSSSNLLLNEDSNSLQDMSMDTSIDDSLDDFSSPYGGQSSFLFDSSSASMVPRMTLPPPNMEAMQMFMNDLSQARKLPPNISKFVATDSGYLVCPACKLKYKRSSDLNRHMKRKHGCKLREFLESDQAPMSVTDEMDLDDGVQDTFTDMFTSDGTNTDMFASNGTNTDMFMSDGTNTDMVEEEIEADESLMDLSGTLDEDGAPVSEEDLQCKYCNFKAKWPSDLKRHMSVHSIEKRFKCNYCPKKYKYIGDMNAHIRKEHNKEPGEVKIVKVATIPRKKTSPALFKCPCCSYTSLWKSEIDRHSRIHTDNKTYQCKNCTYQTYWRGDIRRHVYKHHPEIMTEGVTVDMVIITSKKTPEKPQLLTQPTETATSDAVQITDIPQILPEMPPQMPQLMPGSELSHISPVNNGFELTQQSELRYHLQTTPQKPVQVLVDTPPPPKPESPKRLHMIDLGDGMFKCEFCEFTANAPSKMNSHVATHTNIKRYMCPLCGKRANWKWDISKHIRKDHNDQVTQVVKLSRHDAESTIQQYMETNPTVRRDHHLNTPERIMSTDGGMKFYKCSLCEYMDEQQLSVARHMSQQHAGGDGKILLVRASPSKTPTPERSPSLERLAYSATPSPNSNQTPVKHIPTDNSVSPSDANKPFMCSECGKKAATKADIKKHYHYLHSDKEIRIIYLGDGSQTTQTSKLDINQPKLAENPDENARQYVVPPTSESRKPQKILPTVKPETLGYIRPFKCSICGRRSNWRWDILKHIRERHAGQVGQIITLTEEEARATVQDYVEQEVPVLNKLGNLAPKLVLKDKNHGVDFADEYSIQLEELSAAGLEGSSGMDWTGMYGEWVEQTDVQDMPPTAAHRPFQCSACTFRSTWKGEVQRHILTNHNDQNGATVIMLKKEFAFKTIDIYFAKTSWQKKKSSVYEPEKLYRPPLKVMVVKKVWKCSMCPHKGDDRASMLKHLTVKHNMKAFRCTRCNWTANFRSGVYRHIQNRHGSDKTISCRLGIKLIHQGPGYDDEGELIGSELIPSTSTPVEQAADENIVPQDSGTTTSSQEVTQTEVTQTDTQAKVVRKVMFHCRLCRDFSSEWRSCVCRHLKQAHDNTEYLINCVKKIVKVAQSEASTPSETPTAYQSPSKEGSSPGQARKPRPKNFHCNICPYRAAKAKMLRLHMRCHTPQPGVTKQFKCKFCPYYVNIHRLLTQHLELHAKANMAQKEKTPAQPSPQKGGSRPGSPGAARRHKCDKCPYTTNCKNDFMYHKQFHRPKPTADYKCNYCDYWVTQRRLLKQHMKVHSDIPGYMDQFNDMNSSKAEVPENTLVYDTVEIAEIKQRIIASKITPSISQSPTVSPMKIASTCSMGGKRGFLRKDGTYRKIHRCRNCPYMNVRLRNMRLHELMHGKRTSTTPLVKCPHCDYHVGSKGLLAHHLKVHQPNYEMEMLGLDKDRRESVNSEDSELDTSLSVENKVDTLLEIARYKKYGCEKCPYASAKKRQFQKHVELHGSKQKCKCDYCDYSVPSANLLAQHMKLHLQPNHNLLAAQSIHNLQHLPEMPADVALASMMTNTDSKNPISITHDHIDLFENAPEDAEPKKLYRCDRCPYANLRRDNLLAHLRCHMTKNEFMCPYCDYSVSKNHVLVQHVKVHFSPLPELSEWLTENGDQERIKEVKEKNITEALEIMKMFQNGKQKTGDKETNNDDDKTNNEKADGSPSKDAANVTDEQNTDTDMKTETQMEVDEDVKDQPETEKEKENDETKEQGESMDIGEIAGCSHNGTVEAQSGDNSENKENGMKSDRRVCQYCDREMASSDQLVRHEMQHLIGNSYEEMVSQLLEAARVLENQDQSVQFETSRSTDTVIISDTSSDRGAASDANASGVFIVNQQGEKVGEMTPVKNRRGKLETILLETNGVDKMEVN